MKNVEVKCLVKCLSATTIDANEISTAADHVKSYGEVVFMEPDDLEEYEYFEKAKHSHIQYGLLFGEHLTFRFGVQEDEILPYIPGKLYLLSIKPL